MNRFALIVAGVIVTTGLSTQVAEAQSSTIVAQHTTWLVSKDSQDFNRIRYFLLTHSGTGAPYPSSNVDAERLGDLIVQYSSSGGGGGFTNSQDNPPDYPPIGPGVQPGDTWGISSCINHESQSWGWTAQSNGKGGVTWVLTSYSDQKGVTCGPNSNHPPHNN